MKKLLITGLIFASQAAVADCNMKTASQLTDNFLVGPVQEYQETITDGQCTVRFSRPVNGKIYQIENTQKDRWIKEAALCRYAIKDGTEKLLVQLGGKFQSETITVCADGQKVEKKIKKGDVILENEVGRSKVDGYYTYQNLRCRNFTEHFAEDRQFKVYYGVICQMNDHSGNWVVMDKW